VRHILTVSIPILAAPRCFRWSQFSANVVLICRFFEPRKKRKHPLHYSGYLFKVRNGCVMVWKWGIPPIWRCFKIYSHRERDEEAVDLRTVVAKVFTPGAEAGPSWTGHQRGTPEGKLTDPDGKIWNHVQWPRPLRHASWHGRQDIRQGLHWLHPIWDELAPANCGSKIWSLLLPLKVSVAWTSWTVSWMCLWCIRVGMGRHGPKLETQGTAVTADYGPLMSSRVWCLGSKALPQVTPCPFQKVVE